MGFRSILKYIVVKWLRSARRKNEIGRQTDKLRHSFSKKEPDSIISINLRHFSNPRQVAYECRRRKWLILYRRDIGSNINQYCFWWWTKVGEGGRWRNTWKWNDCFRSQKHSISFSVRRPVLTILPIKTNVKHEKKLEGCQSNFVCCFIVIEILARREKEDHCPSLVFEIWLTKFC